MCDALGVTTFVPRSYIEQVQLLHLTEEFSTITAKARAHFDVGDDVIIDDHVRPSRSVKLVLAAATPDSDTISCLELGSRSSTQLIGTADQH